MSNKDRIDSWNYGNNGGSVYPSETVDRSKWHRQQLPLDLSNLTDLHIQWCEVEDRVLDWITCFERNWDSPSPANRQAENISYNVANNAYQTYRELGGKMGCTNLSSLQLITRYSECIMKNHRKGPMER